MASTVKKIKEWLPMVDTDQANEIRTLMLEAESSGYGTTKRGRAAEAAMEGINVILDGHGVEAIRGDRYVDGFWMDCVALYVNMGDTYNGTVLYRTDTGRFHVTTLGDFVEANQRKYKIY